MSLDTGELEAEFSGQLFPVSRFRFPLDVADIYGALTVWTVIVPGTGEHWKLTLKAINKHV